MAYDKRPVRKLKPEEIKRIKATCKEVHGYPDYWVDEHGKNLYFILSRDINSNGKQIETRKVPIKTVSGYPSAGMVLYESMGYRCEFPGPLDNTLYCWCKTGCFKMSVIVALAWIGPKPNPTDHARHLDGNKKNNHYTNIAWGSSLENGLDTRWHNKVGRGKPESVRPECRDLPHITGAANAAEGAA